ETSTYQATNVNSAVNNALSNVGQTFAVVFVVMFLFLGMRPAAVIACIIPFSICFTLLLMPTLGVDIEQVSIAAVIISLGLLVDNGLVVVEDIEGRINDGVPPKDAAKAAGSQYLVPLGVASITTISAFLPMLMIEGVEGEFSYSLGAVVAAMLLGSWLTAMYILPYLCVLLLKPKAAKGNTSQSGFRPTAVYGALTRRLLPFGLPIGALTIGAIVFSATQFAFLKVEQFPFSERSDFLIYMDMPKGTAISATEDMALRVQDWLGDELTNPGVINSTAYVGDGGPRFNLGLNPADPDPASAFIAVKTESLGAAIDTADRARRHFFENFPEARFRVTRLPQGGSESGIVDVEISGPDAEVLLAAATEIEAQFSTLPALVKNETDWGNKVVKVVLDIAQDKAREFGITSEDISSVLETYFSGTEYSVFRDGDEQIPIVMRADKFSRDTIEDLANMSITDGVSIISIDQVASFKPKLEYSEIRRENQIRQIVVSAKSAEMSAMETYAFIEPTLDALDLGEAYDISIGGEIEDSGDVNAQMGGNLPFALGVMLAALVFQFNSIRRAIVTLLTIPLIMIGAPYLMILTGQPFSFFAMLGLMSLMGIIINNAIVLINQIDIERETKPLDDAIVDAAMQRVRPILLTSLTTSLGLMPMAISGGALFEPMATIMIGGLLVASLISLIFVPSIYRLFMGWGQKGATRPAPANA
ncbi:MAG: efflux RND transporter permease subunit, partial [Pseudomonadota bacterium]